MSEMTGVVRAVAWEDGIEREPYCGLEGCECPDHDYTVPEGTYLTVRVDDGYVLRGIHMGRVKLTYLDLPETEPSARVHGDRSET